MARIIVAALHIFLAALMASVWLAWFVQTRLNALWESGFYGEMSMVTAAVLIASILGLGLAGFQALSSAAYLAGLRWGAWALLGISVLLAFGAPSPLSWLIAAAGGALLFELWATRPNQPAPDED